MITQPVRPIFLDGGEFGVLLLHGFTGTPQCMEEYAQKFHRAKYTVCVPSLEGHQSHHLDLEQTKWEDWYQSSEQALAELHKKCEKIFILGLSMGGLLTLHLAQQHPQTVSAIALLATPLYLDGFLIRKLFPIIWHSPLRWIYKYQTKYKASINDPINRRKYQRYHKFPVSSVAELLELQMVVKNELRYIHQPTLIAHSKGDRTVPCGNLEYLRASLGSESIETLMLKKSNHILPLDLEREKLFKQILRFFNRQKKRKVF